MPSGLRSSNGRLGRLLAELLPEPEVIGLLALMGRTEEARASSERALTLARQEPERKFPKRRLAESG